MKQLEVIKVLANDLGTTDVLELNKALRAKTYKVVKYRITGKSLGHFGFTGVIKNITAEGLKVYEANRVRLIRFTEMDTFDKAKPRTERPKGPKPVKAVKVFEAPSTVKPPKEKKKPKYSDDDNDPDDDFGEPIKKTRIQGSRYIPKK